jgi:hypothetical protein
MGSFAGLGMPEQQREDQARPRLGVAGDRKCFRQR